MKCDTASNNSPVLLNNELFTIKSFRQILKCSHTFF